MCDNKFIVLFMKMFEIELRNVEMLNIFEYFIFCLSFDLYLFLRG